MIHPYLLHDDIADVFAVRLRMARDKCKMTQQKLAEAMEMHPAQISHYERGRNLPSLTTLVWFAYALNVSVDELLGTTNKDRRGARAVGDAA